MIDRIIAPYSLEMSPDTLHNQGSSPLQSFVQSGVALNLAQHGQTGRHRDGIAGQSPRLIYRTAGRYANHNLFFATISSDRHASTDNFSQSGHIRPHMKVSLSPAFRYSEPGHDLVKNQDNA